MWDYGEDNRGPEMAAVSIIVTALSVVAVALRCYTMTAILKRFMVEDCLAVVTCVLQCAFCMVVLLGVSHGLGAHVDNVPVDQRPKALIYKWAGQVAYIIVSTLVKFVVGLFLLHLCLPGTWQRIVILVLLVLVGVYNVFYVFVAIFQCQPVPYYWWRYDPLSPVTGQCNGRALATIPTYLAVVLGIAGDLILALLPITLIKDAQLDTKTKISVICVLALGSLASVATIARIPYARQLISNSDYLSNFADLAIWSIVECGIAITASSLATLRPLFIKMKILATSHLSNRSTPAKNESFSLPFSIHKTTTLVSSSQAQYREAKQCTVTTGTSTASAQCSGSSLACPAGAVGSMEGIQVEKEFELCVIKREISVDSIDRLEAEVNEVIRPGAAWRAQSRERNYAESLRPGSRPTRSITTSAGSIAPPGTGVRVPLTLQRQASEPGLRSHAWVNRKGSYKQCKLKEKNSVASLNVDGTVTAAQRDDGIRCSSSQAVAQPHWPDHQPISSDESTRSRTSPHSPAASFHLPSSEFSSPLAMRVNRPGHGVHVTRAEIYSPKPSGSSGSSGSSGNNNNHKTGQPPGGEFPAHSLSSSSNPTANITRFPLQSAGTAHRSDKSRRRRRVGTFLTDASSISSLDTVAGSDEDRTVTRPPQGGEDEMLAPLTRQYNTPVSRSDSCG